MTQCWSEGALRAYLDRELPTEDMRRVAAHLGDCAICDGLCTELAARAAHVSALLELLPEWSAAMPRPASRANLWRRKAWIGIAAALAACLALAAYLLPNRNPPVAMALPTPAPTPVAVAAAATPAGSGSSSSPAGAPPQAAAVAAATLAATASAPAEQPAPRRLRRVRPTAPEQAYFVALDDEPFESGVIMRVDVKPGNVQADIVFGPDGRAHAFRLVNATQRNF